MKILITGGAGQLGQSFQQLAASYPQHQFVCCSREALDITQEDSVAAFLESSGAGVLVNCAAYTAVDKAETDHEQAFAINAAAPAAMARACRKLGVRMVHISTDYVFGGDQQEAYREDDPVQPVNVYGASKQKGEEWVLAEDPSAVIIRTSWVYAPFGNNFVRTMIRLMQSRPEIGVVADQFGSPTYAPDLAEAVLAMVDSGRWQGGLYHYSNDGVISWYDFALAIRELGGFSCSVKSLTTPEYPTPAKRPAYSVLDKTKIGAVYGVAIKPWHQSLEKCMAQLLAKAG